MLKTYNWPGNIRQLENAVYRAVVLCDGAYLEIAAEPETHFSEDEFHPSAVGYGRWADAIYPVLIEAVGE